MNVEIATSPASITFTTDSIQTADALPIGIQNRHSAKGKNLTHKSHATWI